MKKYARIQSEIKNDVQKSKYQIGLNLYEPNLRGKKYNTSTQAVQSSKAKKNFRNLNILKLKHSCTLHEKNI